MGSLTICSKSTKLKRTSLRIRHIVSPEPCLGFSLSPGRNAKRLEAYLFELPSHIHSCIHECLCSNLWQWNFQVLASTFLHWLVEAQKIFLCLHWRMEKLFILLPCSLFLIDMLSVRWCFFTEFRTSKISTYVHLLLARLSLLPIATSRTRVFWKQVCIFGNKLICPITHLLPMYIY